MSYLKFNREVIMKRKLVFFTKKILFLSLFSATAMLQAQTTSGPATTHPYALAKPRAVPTESAPEWFIKLPEDTTDMLFSAGTAVSTDEQMAYDKARLQAERKLVEMMSGRVKSLIKSSRSDNGDTSTESTTVAVQKMAEGELIGAQRVDSQVTYDGRRYKVYVLLRYPLAENNALRKEREAVQARREGELRAGRAQQELEAQSRQRAAELAEADRKLREQLGPRPESAPILPGTAQTGSIRLLDVDNAEYKKRREEALKKEGAVVGQMILDDSR
jgi:hypothetical protein